MGENLETRRSVHPNSSDIEELFLEAKHWWLSPAEICKILRNYEKLQIASEPSDKPPSGSIFLFDRRVTRNFRKDGHNWRRDHNGKLVKEGHKKLKADGIDVLHCYYALGEENKNFRRHCYSMLEKDFSDIVLVHYLELTGRMEDFSYVKKTEGEIPHSQVPEKIVPNFEIHGSLSSGSRPNTDTCLNGAQPLERENARSAIPGIDLAPAQSDRGKSDNDAESTDDCSKYLNLASLEDESESCSRSESMKDQSLSSSSHPDTVDKLLSDSFDRGLDFKEHSQILAELKGKREDFSCVKEAQVAGPYSQGQESVEIMPYSNLDSSMCLGSHPNNCRMLSVSEYTDTALLPHGAQALEHENAQSEYNHQASSGFYFGLELQQPASEQIDSGGSDPKVPLFYSNSDPTQLDMGNSDMDAELIHDLWTHHDFTSLEHDNAQSEYNHQASSGYHFRLELQRPAVEQIDDGGSDPKFSLFCPNSIDESLSTIPDIESHPTPLNIGNSDTDADLAQLMDDLSRTPLDCTILEDNWVSFTPCGESIEHGSLSSSSRPDTVGKFVSNNVVKRLSFGGHFQIQEKSESSVEGSSSLSESACDAISKFHEQEVNHLELMDSVDPQQKRPDLRNNNSGENHFQRPLSNEKHGYVLTPDLDGDSKFEGKLIYSSSIGQHLFDGLLTEQGLKKRSSSRDNGETGGNENENDVSSIPSAGILDIQDINYAENYSDMAEANLLLCFDKILCSGSSATNPVTSSLKDASQLSTIISSLQKGGNKELNQMLKTGSGTEFCSEKFRDQLLQKHLKEKLLVWILQKDAGGGNGRSILDEDGQDILHLAAALGYDWALKPTIDAGVSVDSRDVNGWTALHWAAFFGRERTVASLISLGAATRALTYPSPKYPSGRTPADLASVNGHKGIAEYLAHCSLDVHISCINLDHQEDLGGPKAVQKISEISAAPLSLGNESDGQSQKDSLAPICDATTELIVLRNFQSSLKKNMPEMYHHKLMHKQLWRQQCRRNRDLQRLLRNAQHHLLSWAAARTIGEEEDEEENEGPDDSRPDDEGPGGKGPEKDEGPEKDKGQEKEKEEGKKRAPDSALESGKACKILKAYSACMALLTAYCIVQSMGTIQMLVLVCVVTFLMLMMDLNCQRFVSREGNTGRIKCVFLCMLVLPPLICLSRSDVDVGVGRLALVEFIRDEFRVFFEI